MRLKSELSEVDCTGNTLSAVKWQYYKNKIKITVKYIKKKKLALT